MVSDLDYIDITFPVSKRDNSKIEQKNNICINVLCYDLVYPAHVSHEKCEIFMDVLLIIDVDNR